MDVQAVTAIVTDGLTKLKATIEQEHVGPQMQRMTLAEQEIINVKGTVDKEVTSMKSTIDGGMLALRADSVKDTESMKNVIEKEMDSVKKRVEDWETKQGAIRQGMEDYVVRTRDETVKNVGNAKAEMEKIKGGMTDMHKEMHTVVSDMYVKMQEMKTEMMGIKHGGQLGDPHPKKSGMPILDTRSIGNLKIIGGDRGEYREWVEKFVNVFGQLKEGWNVMLEWVMEEAELNPREHHEGSGNRDKYLFEEEGKERFLEKMMEHGRMLAGMTEEPMGLNDQARWKEVGERSKRSAEEEWKELGRNLMTVLLEKTTGEARMAVSTVHHNSKGKGKGMLAFYKMHAWFVETSSAGMQDRRTALMQTVAAKSDGEVLGMVNKWYERYLAVGRMGGALMPPSYAVPALKGILTPAFREHLQITYGEKYGEGEGQLEKLMSKIREWATTRKLEEMRKKQKGDPMDWDTSNVEERYGKEKEGSGEQEEWYWWGGEEDWQLGAGQEEGGQGESMDALSKGKGKGKGKSYGKASYGGGWQGGWYRKGGGKGQGAGGKGQGTGKGGKGGGKPTVFFGECYECGEKGHSAKYCPKKAGKGGGSFPFNCHKCGKKGHKAVDCKGVNSLDELNQEEEKGKGDGTLGDFLNLGNYTLDAISVAEEEGEWIDGRWIAKWQLEEEEEESRIMSEAHRKIDEEKEKEEWEKVKKGRKTNRWKKSRKVEEVDAMEVMAVEDFKGSWEVLKVTVDSGASDSVGPLDLAPGVPRRETEVSRRKLEYTVANGGKVVNKGEKEVPMITAEGEKASMTFQMADINKPLASVRRMCEAGNRVVFDEEGSFIENKKTGRKTNIQKERGVYVLTVKVPRAKEESREMGFLWLEDLI